MEVRYNNVLKQLRDLGYFQPMVPDALPLVERLLSDLIQTTESLQKYMTVAKEAIEERDTLELGAEPYKCDNAKLVKECNDLHLAFLHYKEDNERNIRELKRQIAKLENEKAELGDHCQNLKKRICELEGHRSAHQSKKLAKPVIRNKSTSDLLDKKPRCRIHFAEDMSNDKIKRLLEEINQLKCEKLDLVEQAESYKCQIKNREREIDRLQRMLEGGRPITALVKDCCYKGAELKLKQLQECLYNVKKEKEHLEDCLKEAVSKQHEAMKRAVQLVDRNKQLEKELSDIDKMALTVEAECNSTVKNSVDKICKLQSQIHEISLENENFARQLADLKSEREELKMNLEGIKNEKKHLQSVLENALDEKKRLQDRINQFTRIEHDLNMEIDRLVQESSALKRKLVEFESKKCMEYGKKDGLSYRKDSPKDFHTTQNHKWERGKYMKEYRDVTEKLHSATTTGEDIEKQIEEKNKQISALQQQNEQLTSKLQELKQKADADFDSLSLNAANAKRLEREKEILQTDFKHLKDEKDSMQCQLQETVDAQKLEIERLKRELSKYEEQMGRLETERKDLIQSQNSKRSTINELELQCGTVRDQLKACQAELNQQKAMYNQIKSLHEQTDRSLSNSQDKINQLEAQLSDARQKISTLESQKKKLQEEVDSVRNELKMTRTSLAIIDKEKDDLLIQLDNKTEKLAALEADLRSKSMDVISLESNYGDLKKKIGTLSDDLSTKDFQLRNASGQIKTLGKELDEVVRAKENALRENSRLQNEIATLMSQYRGANKELDKANQQIENLKMQLQDYVAQVKKFEDVLQQKEAERSDLLNQFRNLSVEATTLENTNHVLENEATQSKVQLSVTLDHVSDLERKLESRDAMIKNYEKQLAELTSKLANMEISMLEYQKSCKSAESELEKYRDLVSKLDRQKDDLTHKVLDREDRNSQLSRELEKLRDDSASLQTKIERDQNVVERLEKLLFENRQETVSLKIENQDLRSEIERLVKKVEEQQEKLKEQENSLEVCICGKAGLSISYSPREIQEKLAEWDSHRKYSNSNSPRKDPQVNVKGSIERIKEKYFVNKNNSDTKTLASRESLNQPDTSKETSSVKNTTDTSDWLSKRVSLVITAADQDPMASTSTVLPFELKCPTITDTSGKFKCLHKAKCSPKPSTDMKKPNMQNFDRSLPKRKSPF